MSDVTFMLVFKNVHWHWAQSLMQFSNGSQPKTFVFLFNLNFHLHLISSPPRLKVKLFIIIVNIKRLYMFCNFCHSSSSSKNPSIFSPPVQEPRPPSSSCWLLGTFPSGEQALWLWRIVMRLFPNVMFLEALASCRAQPCCVWLLLPSLRLASTSSSCFWKMLRSFAYKLVESYYVKPTICNIHSNLRVETDYKLLNSFPLKENVMPTLTSTFLEAPSLRVCSCLIPLWFSDEDIRAVSSSLFKFWFCQMLCA